MNLWLIHRQSILKAFSVNRDLIIIVTIIRLRCFYKDADNMQIQYMPEAQTDMSKYTITVSLEVFIRELCVLIHAHSNIGMVQYSLIYCFTLEAACDSRTRLYELVTCENKKSQLNLSV